MNDTIIEQAVNTGLQIGEAIKGGNIINGVPDSLLSVIITTLFGFIARAIEKHRLRKNGKLVDKL